MFEFKVDINKDAPVIGVNTTDNRGFTPDELAEQCVEKIISVSDTAHPGIRDQARGRSRFGPSRAAKPSEDGRASSCAVGSARLAARCSLPAGLRD